MTSVTITGSDIARCKAEVLMPNASWLAFASNPDCTTRPSFTLSSVGWHRAWLSATVAGAAAADMRAACLPQRQHCCHIAHQASVKALAGAAAHRYRQRYQLAAAAQRRTARHLAGQARQGARAVVRLQCSAAPGAGRYGCVPSMPAEGEVYSTSVDAARHSPWSLALSLGRAGWSLHRHAHAGPGAHGGCC